MGISHLDRFIYSKCLNCCLMDIPYKYLAITVGGNPRRSEFWSPIINKIKSRLSNWKGRLLSNWKGKLILMRVVLFPLLSCFLV